MKKIAKKKTKKPTMPSQDDPKPDEKLFDCGGLPDRNLKKNLGC